MRAINVLLLGMCLPIAILLLWCVHMPIPLLLLMLCVLLPIAVLLVLRAACYKVQGSLV